MLVFKVFKVCSLHFINCKVYYVYKYSVESDQQAQELVKYSKVCFEILVIQASKLLSKNVYISKPWLELGPFWWDEIIFGLASVIDQTLPDLISNLDKFYNKSISFQTFARRIRADT